MTYVYVTRPDNKGERHIIKQPKPIPPVTQELLKLTYLPQKRKAKNSAKETDYFLADGWVRF